MNKLMTAALLFLSLSAQAATSIKEVYALIASNKAILVDVREEDEIKEGMLEKATWYPLSKIQKGKTWEQDFATLAKDKKVFLYCRSGRRSGMVNDMLKVKGIASESIGGYDDLKKQIK
jgi:phage shock protein E